MTQEEMMMMQPTQEYMRKLQRKRNAGTEDCILSSELANEFGISAIDLHRFLIDIGFLYRDSTSRELRLSPKYNRRGYAKKRSHFRYTRTGDLKETRFPVWTPKGQAYIKNLIQGKMT